MDSGLRDRCVLITGASGGIGQAAACAFAAEGAKLALHYRAQRQPVESLCQQLGADAIAVQADLRKEADADALVATSLERLGRIDAIVVNAGIWPAEDVPMHCMSLGQWQETVATGLTGAFLTCRAFLCATLRAFLGSARGVNVRVEPPTETPD